MNSDLDRITGDAVKALGGGKIGGYLVRYSTEQTPDLVGDFFTPESELGYHENLPVLYHHKPTASRRNLALPIIRLPITRSCPW